MAKPTSAREPAPQTEDKYDKKKVMETAIGITDDEKKEIEIAIGITHDSKPDDIRKKVWDYRKKLDKDDRLLGPSNRRAEAKRKKELLAKYLLSK
jgi:hypothetical protein